MRPGVHRGRGPGRRAALALALALVGCAAAEMPPSAPSDLLGEPAPAFSRRALDGRQVDTAALRGNVVVVEFFAEYCKPCWKHLPRVQRWARRHRDVAVIGIGADEYASATRGMAERLELGFPVVHDAGLGLTARFRVDKIPTTLVLDREGRVRWRSFPGDGVEELDRAVAAVRRGGG